ncbi:MAG: TonB-dependent receptor [Nostoc sp.]
MLVQLPTPSNPNDQREDRGSEVIQITGVKANPTSKGVEVILETPVGTQLQVTNRSTGSNFIVDVFGGQLRLPSGEAFTFRSDQLLAGITEITAQNIDANTVRVTVVGEKALPTVELYDDNAGLVFAVATTATATSPQQPTQQPQTQQPENQIQPTQPSASGDEPIELVVTGEQDNYRATDGSTATRTDTPLRDVPQSIQVIPQQVWSRLFATPENAVSLWTTYEFQRSGLKGFGVGLGLFYVGEREGDLKNDFQLPDYLRTDVTLFYKYRQLRAQLNFINLFNIDYFETTGGQITRVVPGSPFMVEGRISWEF